MPSTAQRVLPGPIGKGRRDRKKKASDPGDRRFHSIGEERRKWLLKVEELTQEHRERLARAHALRAQLALQNADPSDPVRPELEAIDRPVRIVPPLKWCACNTDCVVVDVVRPFGMDKHPECGGFIPHAWELFDTDSDYLKLWSTTADLIVERSSYTTWCDCHEPLHMDSPLAAVTDDPIRWCHACDHPAEPPRGLEWSTERTAGNYRALVGYLYAEAAGDRAIDTILERSQDRHEPTEEMRRRDRELGHTIDGTWWSDTGEVYPPAEYLPPEPRPGELQAPRGTVTGHQWHKSREKGQREKFDRVGACGGEEIRQVCGSCKTPGKSIPLSCDNHRLCLHCRGRRVNRFRKRFRAAQDRCVQELWRNRLGVSRYSKAGRLIDGGKWGEKFLTLTLPHSGDAPADVGELQSAWRTFWRLLRTHIKKDVLAGEEKQRVGELLQLMKYTRVLEITEGERLDGHAHLHVWFVAPFIHHTVIRHLWGRSLSFVYRARLPVGSTHDAVMDLPSQPAKKQGGKRTRLSSPRRRQLLSYLRTRRGIHGRTLRKYYKPVIHVEKVEPNRIGAELCKYLVKDGFKDGENVRLIDPSVFARLYIALEGRRAIATTRGLFKKPEPGCYCKACGGTFRRVIGPVDLGPDPRGPPEDDAQLELPGVTP